MKKYNLMLILLMSLLMLPVSVQSAKHFTLDESQREVAEKIGGSSHILANSNLAVVGVVESTNRTRLPLSSVLEDDLMSFLTEKSPFHKETINKYNNSTRQTQVIVTLLIQI